MSLKDEKPHSPVDEKASIEDEKPAELPTLAGGLPLSEKLVLDGRLDVGDVYENVRAIDLGEDGKERPIGMCTHSLVLAMRNGI